MSETGQIITLLDLGLYLLIIINGLAFYEAIEGSLLPVKSNQ
jgi:hypothetical protein